MLKRNLYLNKILTLALIGMFIFSANTLIAQNLNSSPDVKIENSEKPWMEPMDPLESVMILKVDNPCKDERYLELKEIPLDEMTDRQFEVYKQKDEACQEYLNTVENNEAEKQTADTIDNAYKTYYYVAGAGLLISLVYLLSI